MRAAAELGAEALFKSYHPHPLTILLAEERHRPHRLRLLDRRIREYLQLNALPNLLIHDALYLLEFTLAHFLKVRKVKAQMTRLH